MKILLDAWGIGKRVCLNKKYKMEISSGVYGVGGPGFRQSVPTYTIPPMITDGIEYIDLIPFLLFEKIFLDKSSYNFICQNRMVPQGTKELFEYLKKQNIIEILDYKAILEKNALRIIQESKAMVKDENIYPLVVASAHSWKKYLTNLGNERKVSSFTSDTVEAIDDYINAFKNVTEIDQETLNLLEHQLWDVKCLKALHEELECPVYFWKDYGYFYAIDFLDDSIELIRKQKDYLSKLWDLYVPLSMSTNPDLFVKIREDRRIIDLRKFIIKQSESDATTNEKLLREVKAEIANIDGKAEKFNKITGFLFLALSLKSPELCVAGTIGSAATIEIIKRILKRKYRWHYFLQNSHDLYTKADIKVNE